MRRGFCRCAVSAHAVVGAVPAKQLENSGHEEMVVDVGERVVGLWCDEFVHVEKIVIVSCNMVSAPYFFMLAGTGIAKPN